MVFSSTVFLFLFLPLVITAYYTVGRLGRSWKNAILLLASLGFYAWGEPLFVFVMIIAVLVNWLAVLWMDRLAGAARKGVCAAMITLDVLLLFVFKYVSFVSRNIALLTGGQSRVIDIALPIGISFFTFQMMSYVFDVYYRKEAVQRSPFKVLLYISFFPQLIAGPIVRYGTIARELDQRTESLEAFSAGIIRFTYGLGKKALLANYLAVSADAIFGTPERSLLTAWFGAVCYTLQIYFDFSGYSDMAIGLGEMFGFHFPENFNYPYMAASVTDFWRRWHISLSSWFRDYVYIPLGGNRVSGKRWVLNLFTVWLLTGIWHGANWTFIVWGLLYFVLLLAEKRTGFAQAAHKWYSHIYTMAVVIIAWAIFRAETIGQAAVYLGNLFAIGVTGLYDALLVKLLVDSGIPIICSIVLALPTVKWLESKMASNTKTLWTVGTSAVIFALSVISCIAVTYQPFIYFNF